MTSRPELVEAIDKALRPNGLFARGVVALGEGEGPLLKDGRAARAIVLVGNIGGSMWQAFSAWAAERSGANPLDTWSKSVLSAVAVDLGATAFYPSDRPYQPFQRWAKRAEGLRPSVLGILIHPVYGLWHGYRGALAFGDEIEAPAELSGRHPCDDCHDKPCLASCPVGAVRANLFQLHDCRHYLASETGPGGCLDLGCRARNACPVGAGYRYPDAQLRFHMRALSLP